MSDISFYNTESMKKTAINKNNHYLRVPVQGGNGKTPFQRMKSNSIATDGQCNCPMTKHTFKDNSTDWNIPAEKSSLILVAIVLLFILTHSYRLALKVYEVLMPQGNTYENFKRCFFIGR